MTKKFIIPAAVLLIVIISFLLFANQNNAQTPGEPSAETQPITGTVTHVENGVDGVSVELTTSTTVYSVTISIIQAEVFGTFSDITEGAELEVSGEIIEGMEPTLLVARKVRVLGIDPDYVINLLGTVKSIEPGKDGITAVIETEDGTAYSTVISLVTSEVIYIGDSEEIEVGTSLLISGDLFELDLPAVASEIVVVNPIGFGK